MPELLLELLSEEIPARMQAKAAEDLKRLVTERLKEAGLECSDARAFATPRRLTLVVDGLPKQTPARSGEKRGPSHDASLPALRGFAHSVDLPPQAISRFESLRVGERVSFDDNPELKLSIEVRDTKRGAYFFAIVTSEGKVTRDLLPDLIRSAIQDFAWPKSMRWKEGQTQGWVRPLHGILAIFDGKKLDLEYNLIHIPAVAAHPSEDNTIFASNETAGHRFLAPERFEVKGFEDYREKLEKAYVVLDGAEREKIIRERAEKRAAEEGLTLKPDDALVAENAGMVEWPVVLMGKIGESFMDLPPEVLTTAMRAHQKYFSLIDKHGKLAPRFILVSNIETKDKGKTIVAGNERVLRARLADAKFFWDQDRKESLASRAPALRQIVFHAKLGSLDEKIDRVQALAVEIAAHVPGAGKDQVRSAARLCKADLTTGMVGEFPDLQGVMGRYYALHDGEAAEVADAIGEHYAPRGPRDRCPSAPVSVALALADKIDSLVGFFAIGEKPTGSKDPFALRRAALGVIRLVLENRLRVPLAGVFDIAFSFYDEGVLKDLWVRNVSVHSPKEWIEEMEYYAKLFKGYRKDGIHSILLDFLTDRLKVHLRDKGVRHDLIAAIFSEVRTGVQEDDLLRVVEKAKALSAYLDTPQGQDLLTAYRRASNIVRDERGKDWVDDMSSVDPKFLQEKEEKNLHASLTAIERVRGIDELGIEYFVNHLNHLSSLRDPIDSFFDHVRVNVDDSKLRNNRLTLLNEIRLTLDAVADFSKIEG
ncbi:MAG: glycine--tRNA ligase subunit beta [Proteobacteria bacterium]|nr:glycine--tRNA ligase subunit beta [Pseudomonadota bacterium]